MIEDNRYNWSHLKTRNVTVSVTRKPARRGFVFRVGHMMDLGTGRQTVMLENVDYPKPTKLRHDNVEAAVPLKMGSLDFIYASGKKPSLRNIRSLLSCVSKGSLVEDIVLDVIAPGDLLVFEQDPSSMKIKLVQTLRVVKQNSYQKSTTRYAL